jgi:hypothetical protein
MSARFPGPEPARTGPPSGQVPAARSVSPVRSPPRPGQSLSGCTGRRSPGDYGHTAGPRLWRSAGEGRGYRNTPGAGHPRYAIPHTPSRTGHIPLLHLEDEPPHPVHRGTLLVPVHRAARELTADSNPSGGERCRSRPQTGQTRRDSRPLSSGVSEYLRYSRGIIVC